MTEQTIEFLDKNGQKVSVGDKLISDANIEVNVVSQVYVDELQQTVLFAQQVKNPFAFSYLTVENLALQFTKVV